MIQKILSGLYILLINFFLINTVCSSENDVYKKIDLFGEVLEKN